MSNVVLTQLVYCSQRRPHSKDQPALVELRDILATARANNRRDGITGYLIAEGQHFLQILEGDERQVTLTYERIEKDSRHAGIVMIGKRRIVERGFGEWSMGAAMRTVDRRGIFLDHGIGDDMDPARLSAATVVALASALVAYDRGRKAQRKVAA